MCLWCPWVAAHAKMLALSFLGNSYEFFGYLILTFPVYRCPTLPLPGMRYALSSCHSYLSSQFLLGTCFGGSTIACNFSVTVTKPWEGRVFLKQVLSCDLLGFPPNVEVQLASAVAHSPATAGSSLKTLDLKVFSR